MRPGNTRAHTYSHVLSAHLVLGLHQGLQLLQRLAWPLLLTHWGWFCGCLGLQLSHLRGKVSTFLRSAFCSALPKTRHSFPLLGATTPHPAEKTLGSDTLLRWALHPILQSTKPRLREVICRDHTASR